jgi:hypothetical protein
MALAPMAAGSNVPEPPPPVLPEWPGGGERPRRTFAGDGGRLVEGQETLLRNGFRFGLRRCTGLTGGPPAS